MSYSISRLPEKAKQSIFFHRYKANRFVAASLGLVMMTSPCSNLLAENLLSTPVPEKFVVDRAIKKSGFLDDLINHNAYLGHPLSFALNPNTTHLTFVMNHENERSEKTDSDSQESAGAAALQPQPLIQIPLPPMNHAQITAIIQGVNTGFDEDTITLNNMLSYVPVAPPNESLTILSMIQQVLKALNVVVDDVEDAMIDVLFNIRGTESPVDMTKPEDRENLAMLMVSYYTAIHSKRAHPEAAHLFFSSFLLRATKLSGIGRLVAKKGDLLGTKKPIESHEVLKANVKESGKVFNGLKVLEEMRLSFLLQVNDPIKSEEPETLDEPLLIAASSLLNNEINENEMPLYQRNIKSAERMSYLVKKYGKEKPELVASNSQFVSLIDAISLILDPFVIQQAKVHVDNISSYFSASNWDDTITSSSEIKDKEQTLFKIFEKVLKDAEDYPGSENPELFQELLLALRQYIEQQLQKTFPDENDYQVIMVTLGTGFADLIQQSGRMLAFHMATFDINANQQPYGVKPDEAAKKQEGKQLSKEEKKRKHLEERIEYLDDFVDWFIDNYNFAMRTPYNSDSSDSESIDSDTINTGSSGYDSSGSDISGSDIRDTDMPDSDTSDTDMPDSDTSDTDMPDSDTSDTDMPDSDTTDTNMPDSDTSDTDMPDSDTTDTNMPDSDTSSLSDLRLSYCGCNKLV